MSGREELNAYIAELRKALDGADTGVVEDIVSEVRAHVEDSAGKEVYDNAVHDALEELGPPEAYAQEMLEAAGESKPKTAGRVLGIPYDVGMPTSRKIADRMWNPGDPRVFVPRVWGMGWDVNFGSIAVRLGLVRPDYDDVPFEAVPDWALSLAFAVPVALEAGALAVAALNWGFSGQVPTHFGLSGPDRFGSIRDATAGTLGPLVAATLAVWAGVFVRKGSKAARAVSAAFLTLLAVILCPSFVVGVYHGLNGVVLFSPLWAVLAAFAVTLAMLVALSRLGVSTEMKEQKETSRGSGEV